MPASLLLLLLDIFSNRLMQNVIRYNILPSKKVSTFEKSILGLVISILFFGIILFVLFIFSGFQLSDESTAAISRGKPHENFTLYLSNQTNHLAFGHSGLHYVVETYEFSLLKPPDGYTIYPVSKLIMGESHSSNIGRIISGEIIVDLKTSKVSVKLTTNNGPFSGNKEYPITFVSN